jgi:hypothetical protein
MPTERRDIQVNFAKQLQQLDGWELPYPLIMAVLDSGVSEATLMMQTIAEPGAGVAGAQSIYVNIYPSVSVTKYEQKERWLAALIEVEYCLLRARCGERDGYLN